MTTIPPSPHVQFLTVSDHASKLQQVCAVIHKHFMKSDFILIAVPSPEAAAYLDQLLWKTPEESFLPHVVAHGPTQERVVITTASTNINKAKVLVNLLPTIHPEAHTFHLIYELLDLTSKEKEEVSRKKEAHYRQNA